MACTSLTTWRSARTRSPDPAAGRGRRAAGVRPDRGLGRHLHLPGGGRAVAAGGVDRDRPRGGDRPGGGERVREDHPCASPGQGLSPQSGTVPWDDVSIADVDGGPLRERIAVIAQDHGNWPLTVRDNVVMGRLLDEALLESAVAASGADTVIAELARGYDALLARQFKDGAELSGGQWRRVGEARGFYRTAPLLIMDEPTAALDARAEYALFSSLRTLARDRTVLIITHRLASVRHADRIYVLAHGKVIESGAHADLIAAGRRSTPTSTPSRPPSTTRPPDGTDHGHVPGKRHRADRAWVSPRPAAR